MNRLCVYCGSSSGHHPDYFDAAATLGMELAQRDIGLVYGGASVGLMGAVADAVMQHGGAVIGVIPKSIAELEVAHEGLTELRVVSDMHQRKAMMTDLSDGVIALPGGLGTLEELFEALTWLQLGFHAKPCAVLNINGYYDKLFAFLDHIVSSGFAKRAHVDSLLVADNVSGLINQMARFKRPGENKI